MPRSAVIDEVYARLAANWSLSPVIEEGTQGDIPTGGTPFIVVDFPMTESAQWSVARDCRERGTIRFCVYTEIGEGYAKGYAHAEALAAIFRLVKTDSVEYRVPTLRQGVHDGIYFKVIVTIPYFFNYAG